MLDYIFKSWTSAREFDSRERLLPGDSLMAVWNLVPSIINNGNGRMRFGESGMASDLLLACEEVSERGQISIHSLERLSRGRVPPHLFMEAVKYPREQRVVAFDNTIRQLVYSTPNDSATNFVVGYLASLVSDGSLEHSQLVFPLQNQFPTAMLWYGVCAALSPTSRVMTDYGHLGLRILRMLERGEDLMTPPTSDISLAELEVMLRGQPRSRYFRQTHASSLRIELAPGVTTLTRNPASQSIIEQPGLFGEETRQPSVETDRLKELVYGLRNSLAMAESILSNKNSSTTIAGPRTKRKR